MFLKILIFLLPYSFSLSNPVIPYNYNLQNVQGHFTAQDSANCPENYFFFHGLCYPSIGVNNFQQPCDVNRCGSNIQINIQPSTLPSCCCDNFNCAKKNILSPCNTSTYKGNAEAPSMPCASQTPCFPLTPYSSGAPCIPQTPCTPQKPSSPPDDKTTTTTLAPIIEEETRPPAPIIRCPDNTINIGGKCRLIYCGKGVYRNGKCIQTVCPEGTEWSGNKCQVLEPIVHNIVKNYTAHNTFNFNTSKIVLENPNVINISDAIALQITDPQIPLNKAENTCCEVRSPRICEKNETNWNCFFKRQNRCGDFCTAPIIHLKPLKPQYIIPYLVIPPMPKTLYFQTNIFQPNPFDCSGCVTNLAVNCPNYCSMYNCHEPQCFFVDQKEYCTKNPNQFGCVKQDGCLDDWCH